METEAIRKALHFLKDKVSISEVVTDASRTVMALMGKISLFKIIFRNVINNTNTITERGFSQYFHSLDVWHKSKKLKKCLAKVGTNCRNLIGHINNNLSIIYKQVRDVAWRRLEIGLIK